MIEDIHVIIKIMLHINKINILVEFLEKYNIRLPILRRDYL